MSASSHSHFDTLSRTTSNRGSTTSRSQSLVSHPTTLFSLGAGQEDRLLTHSKIKKNTASHELKPSDILIERFTAWKAIVKMLICK